MEQTKKMSPQTSEGKKKNCKQTVTITDEGKAIIKAHNGMIDAEGNSSVYLNGEFSIDADSVHRLSAALQGKSIYVVRPGFCGLTYTEVITSDKAIATTIENLKKEIETQITENRALIDNLKKAELKHSKLLNDIKHFNATRRPWERKMEIAE